MRNRIVIIAIAAAAALGLGIPTANAAGISVCLGELHLSVAGTTVIDQAPGCVVDVPAPELPA